MEARTINPVIIDQHRRTEDPPPAETAEPPVLILTTTGDTTGEPHTTALAYIQDGPRFVVAATAGHGPSRPDWYRNLVASPWGTIDIGSGARAVNARLAEGADRDRLLDRLRSTLPGLAEFCRHPTSLPVVILTPKRPGPAEPVT
jgi:F420H(2)-dependent quinone reductase